MDKLFTEVPIQGVFTLNGVKHIRKVKTNGHNAYVKDTGEPVLIKRHIIVQYSGRRTGTNKLKSQTSMKRAPRRMSYCCY